MPAKLRNDSRLYCQAAADETDPHLKRRLANHALALALLAEKTERKLAMKQAGTIPHAKVPPASATE